jgi:hypothetical protein
MKVVCKFGIGYELTLNGTYEIIDTRFNAKLPVYKEYLIMNNDESMTWYNSEFFKTISDIRDEKINSILA